MRPAAVPLFPLPGLVLFPRTAIPLHIFEPRYVALFTDALAGDRRVATGSLRKGWEQQYHGAPPVHRIITVARILDEERLPGGRFNVLLEGIERANVVEETRKGPYRVVRAKSLVEQMSDSERGPIREALRDLLASCRRMGELLPELRAPLGNLENTHLHPGIIADQVASLLVRDAYERQSLLEETRVLRRIELVHVQVRSRLLRLEAAHQHGELDLLQDP